MKHAPLCLCALAVLLLPALVVAQPPTLTHAVPSAVAPGQTVDVTFYGGALAGSNGMWTNLPLTWQLAPGIENNGNIADHVVYRITVPGDAQVGIGGVRLATGQGLSNTRLLLIDDLPSGLDNGNNHTKELAQEVGPPLAVDGTCEAEVSDFYKLNIKAGQRVSIEVLAQRIGSALDPVMRLMDASGRELAYSDDEPGVGFDCRLAYQFPADGVYLIELRDMRYQGSAAHRYRLRLGDFPLVTVPYPLGAQRGTSTQVTVAGPSVEAVAPLTVTMPPDLASSQLSLGAKYPTGQGSALVHLVASGLPEAVETEPNNEAAQSTPVVLPGAINGRFEAAKDRDFFQFEAKNGQRLVFNGKTRSLGSPTDLFMRLLNADGGVVAEAEDNGMDDGQINFTFPADGVYRLVVEDLLHRGGPAHAYRVEVEPYQPGFALSVEAEKYDCPKGGVFPTKVTSIRRDYNGPITLEIQGGGDGFQVTSNVIAEGQNEVVMNVTIPSRIESGAPVVLNVVGRAKIGEADFSTKASTLTPLRVALSALPYPPADLDGAIGLSVGGVFPDFFQLAVEGSEARFPQLIGSGTFNVVATKLNNFNDPITLAVEGLPEGFTAEVPPIAKDQTQVAIVIKGPEAAPEGEHKIRITGAATFQNQPKSVVLAEVPLKVIKPLGIALAPAGTIAVNGVQKIKVTVMRYGEDKGVVTLAFKNLPTGVTAPEGAAVAEGQNEVELEFKAAADAVVGKIENLIVAATAKVKGNDVAVESAPTPWEVVTQ